MQFGVFSYVPDARDAAEAGAMIRAWGFDVVKIHRTRPDDCLATPLTAQRSRAIRRAYESHGVQVVAFAAYRDIATPDAERRAEARNQMIEWIRWAPELGAPLVCTEATVESGHLPPVTSQPHRSQPQTGEEPFRILIDEVGNLERYAREAGVAIALEPSTSTPLGTTERALTLLRGLNSPHIKLIFDPANVMTEEALPRQREHYAALLDVLAPYIALAHAKDFAVTDAGRYTPAAGRGLLDWTTIFAELRRVGYGGPVVLEHLTADQVPTVHAYLSNALEQASRL